MAFLLRPAPSPEELVGLILAFEDVCAEIPTFLLHRTFKTSMKLRDREGRPVYWDGRALLMAYHELCESAEGLQLCPDNRSLPANAESQCPRCFGSGWEKVSTSDGNGAVKKCDHAPINF